MASTPSAPAPLPRATSWPLTSALIATGIVGSFQIGKAAVALPALRAEFGLSLADAAWVLSVFTLIGVGLGIFVGTFAERVGVKRVLVGGEAAVAAGAILSVLAPNFSVVLAGRVVEGFGFLCASVTIPTLLRELAAPRDRAFVLGLWSVYMPVGVAAGLAGGPLLIAAFGWRGLWLTGAALAAACGLGLAAALPALPRRQREGGRVLADVVRVATTPGPLLYGCLFGGQALTWFAVTGFLPVLLIARLHVPLAIAGPLAAAATFSSAFGNVGASLLRRSGVPAWQVVLGAMVVQALIVFGLFSTAVPALFSYGLAFVFVICGGMVPGVSFDGAAALTPEPRLTPLTMGLVTQFSNLGQLAGPVIVGTVVEHAGWPAAAYPVLAVIAMVAGLALVLRRMTARMG